ncbi:Meiotic recombination protein rec12 [Colletotrichum trifolii]|uniref:DNA topoisomerase (ATP-hydrolyzing) n=1 Tax=Colletotrichum trifolii TaxID=5466 RepID=A0A4R8RSI4_COLTR|nr:Meiotic recombination protein rec12 [Colletotrichum trifolii]
MDDAISPLLGGHQHGQLIPQHVNPPRSVVNIPDPDPNNNNVGTAVAKIAEILSSCQESLINGEEMSIPYRTRPTRRAAASGNPARPRPAPSVVRFPGRSANEAARFTQVFKILQLSLSALLSGNPITKRNIYYQCQDLFGNSQTVVDRLVDDLAYTLGLGRDFLNIVAASKGLVAGPVILLTRMSAAIDASTGDAGVLIPQPRNIGQIDFGTTQWVLGKGYADLATRQFVHTLHAARPELPVLALVDYDPDGISIMRCYSHGSRAHAHEQGVTVPSLQWLGVRSNDVASRVARGGLGFDDQYVNGALGSINPLTQRDRTRARNIIKDLVEESDSHDVSCRRELQVMLFLGIKAEIQAMDDAGDMTAWLDEHMRDFLYGDVMHHRSCLAA